MAILAFAFVDAQQISEQEALAKAYQFFSVAKQGNKARSMTTRRTPKLVLANNSNELYAFNDEANGGYVIVSGDKRMPDVLAYSYDGSYDVNHLPCNMQAWMNEYAAQVAYLRTHPKAKVARRTASAKETIEPMLACAFGQGKYYNDKCPVVDGEHCPTGCVATSIAQIMHYWKWPKQTTEVIPAYTTKTLKIHMPSQPITTIDWDNMLNQYSSIGNYSQKQIDAIATLMLLCGSSIEMDYNKTVSNAGGPNVALQKYFGYNELIDVVDRSAYDTEEWEQMIYDELKDGRPVLYGGGNTQGGGHGFVLDGYNDGYFHVNWGWDGVYSWVLMTDVEGWYDFINNHSATIGVQPSSPDFPCIYSVLDNGKLTLYYDKEKNNRTGKILKTVEWKNHKEEITECVIDPSYSKIKPKDLCAFFEGLNKMKSIKGIENLNTSKVWNMAYMFNYCSSLENLDVSGFKTDKVTSMWAMFSDCSSLKALDVSGFKTENVNYMAYMFHNCSCLTSIDVSGFVTDNATDIGAMFDGCSGLTTLDLSNFKTDKVKSMWHIFCDCSRLTTIYASEKWNMSNVETKDWMFYNCPKLVGGEGTTYNEEYVNGEYAHIDRGPSNPGYFTRKDHNTGISKVLNRKGETDIYTPNGIKLAKPQKGLNIILNSDGSVRKIHLR